MAGNDCILSCLLNARTKQIRLHGYHICRSTFCLSIYWHVDTGGIAMSIPSGVSCSVKKGRGQMMCDFYWLVSMLSSPCTALSLVVRQLEGHLVCKNLLQFSSSVLFWGCRLTWSNCRQEGQLNKHTHICVYSPRR